MSFSLQAENESLKARLRKLGRPRGAPDGKGALEEGPLPAQPKPEGAPAAEEGPQVEGPPGAPLPLPSPSAEQQGPLVGGPSGAPHNTGAPSAEEGPHVGGLSGKEEGPLVGGPCMGARVLLKTSSEGERPLEGPLPAGAPPPASGATNMPSAIKASLGEAESKEEIKRETGEGQVSTAFQQQQQQQEGGSRGLVVPLSSDIYC